MFGPQGERVHAGPEPPARERPLDEAGVTRPLMATKLYVPRQRRGLVARPRLVERLETGAEARLTLVSAPAGFGKTTLLAEWLHEGSASARCVAWLSLDTADNEPVVVLDLRGDRAPEGRARRRLELRWSSSRPHPCRPSCVLTTLLNELAAAPDEVWLVLDDYHLVDDPRGRPRDDLPAGAPPAARPRRAQHPRRPRSAAGPVAGARRAGRDPGRRPALHLRRGRRLPQRGDRPASSPPADVEVLEERTEGWIAALQLAALSLQGRDGRQRLHRPVRRERPLHRRLPGRGGAGAPARRRCASSCCSQRSSTGSPGRCATPSPAARTAATCSRPWSAPTCSSSPWTTGGSGTATTTCSPTCCGRGCSASSRTRFRCCTSAPASGTSPTT